MDVSGPWLFDDLQDQSTTGTVYKGEFTQTGWSPGTNGSLTYSLPSLPQGLVEFDVKGLNRNGQNTVLFTMYEKPDIEDANPYILNNPYRVTLTLQNFNRYPTTPFLLLWTIKDFPAATETKERYIQGIPSGVEGIEEYVDSSNAIIIPEQTYHVKLEWKHGIVRLFLDGKNIAESNYQPMIYDPDSTQIVFGTTPGEDTFGMPGLEYSNIKISYPKF